MLLANAQHRPRSSPGALEHPVSDHRIEVVQDRVAFADLLAALRREPVIGMDTEAASFHRYHDRVYLLQLSSPTRTAVVDPLALGGLAALEELLLEPGIEFVLHDADYDLRLLHREYGFRLRRLFDTRIAAQFTGEPAIGLGALLQRYFGVVADKRMQRADWSERPLTPAMVAYAATDTRFLPALQDRLRADLAQLGRVTWVAEECELQTRVQWTPGDPPETAFLRIKGSRSLERRGLGVLRELYLWRESTAAGLDRAAFRVLGNAPLVALAAERPRSVEALARVPGMGRRFSSAWAGELLAAIERGLAVPESELPRFERRPRPRRDPAYEARLARLKEVRAELVTELRLPPGLLCPNATLESIAREQPGSTEALARLDTVRRWQVEAFGSRLVAALRQAS